MEGVGGSMCRTFRICVIGCDSSPLPPKSTDLAPLKADLPLPLPLLRGSSVQGPSRELRQPHVPHAAVSVAERHGGAIPPPCASSRTCTTWACRTTASTGPSPPASWTSRASGCCKGTEGASQGRAGRTEEHCMSVCDVALSCVPLHRALSPSGRRFRPLHAAPAVLSHGCRTLSNNFLTGMYRRRPRKSSISSQCSCPCSPRVSCSAPRIGLFLPPSPSRARVMFPQARSHLRLTLDQTCFTPLSAPPFLSPPPPLLFPFPRVLPERENCLNPPRPQPAPPLQLRLPNPGALRQPLGRLQGPRRAPTPNTGTPRR